MYLVGIVDATLNAIQAGLVALVSFIPALIGAILILIVGWIIAGVLGRLVTMLLGRVGFDQASERAGITGFIRQSGARDMTPSGVFGWLVKWFVRLIFLEAAAAALRLEAITNIINQIILFIPNLVVALVVLWIGFLAGRFVGALVRGATAQAGFDRPGLLAGIAQYAIVAFAVVVAVEQIGVATSLVNLLFAAVVGALALAFALAFGLGGREVAGQVWRTWYGRMQQLGPQGSGGQQTALRGEGTQRQTPPPQPTP